MGTLFKDRQMNLSCESPENGKKNYGANFLEHK